MDLNGVMRRYPSALALLSACAEFSGSAHLGILLAQIWPLPELHPSPADTPTWTVLSAALADARGTLDLNQHGQIILGWAPGTVRVNYVITDNAMESGAVAADFEIAMACRILCKLLGPEFTPELVELPRRAPRDARAYRRAFACPVAFNASVATIHVNAAALQAPTKLRVGRKDGVGADWATDPAPLGDLVARELALKIALGESPSAARVATVLNMGCRTLQRQLEHAQTSFRLLCDGVRFGMAKRLLRDTDIDLTNMALSLGYSDVSVLTRAFTRWAGTCPSNWRASHPAREPASRRAPEMTEGR
ncbi:AraC family transcriptional regulator [Aquabacter cavernae]|uniref:AraC family transcriptional regulator n=1 Tax=Aquabacter cavernae TaxID=2496029 RepID=UPI0013E01C4A|nr:AraC family transcriptional regulator [Aquabacter cavernae]